MNQGHQRCDTDVLKAAIEKFEERNKTLERRESAIIKILAQIEKEKASTIDIEEKIKEVISDSKRGIVSETRPEELTFYNDWFNAGQQDNLHYPRSRIRRSPDRGPYAASDRGAIPYGGREASLCRERDTSPFGNRYNMTWRKDCTPCHPAWKSDNSYEKLSPTSLQDYTHSSGRVFKANSGANYVREMSPASLRREHKTQPAIQREAITNDPDVQTLREVAEMDFVDHPFSECNDRGIKTQTLPKDSVALLRKDQTRSFTKKEFSRDDEKDINAYMKSFLSPSVQDMISSYQKRQQTSPVCIGDQSNAWSRPSSRGSSVEMRDRESLSQRIEIGTLLSSPSRRSVDARNDSALHTDSASICSPYTDSDKDSNDVTGSSPQIQRSRPWTTSGKNKMVNFIDDVKKFTHDQSSVGDGRKKSLDQQHLDRRSRSNTVEPKRYEFDDDYNKNFLVFLIRNCLPKALFKTHYNYKYKWSDVDMDDILNKLDEIEIVKRIFREELDYREKIKSQLKLQYDDRRVLLRNIMYADGIKRGFAKGIPVCAVMALFTETRAIGNIKEFTLQILRQANELLGEFRPDPIGLEALEKTAVERVSKLKELGAVPETPQSSKLLCILKNLIERESVINPCDILEKCIHDLKNLLIVDETNMFDEVKYLTDEIHRLKNIMWSIGEFMSIKEMRDKSTSNKFDCQNKTPTKEVANQSSKSSRVDRMGPEGLIKENDWFNGEVERIKKLVCKLENEILPSAIMKQEASKMKPTTEQKVMPKEHINEKKITLKKHTVETQETPKEHTIGRKVMPKEHNIESKVLSKEYTTEQKLMPKEHIFAEPSGKNEELILRCIKKLPDNTNSNQTSHQRKDPANASSPNCSIQDDSLPEESDLKNEVGRLKSIIDNIEHHLENQPITASKNLKDDACVTVNGTTSRVPHEKITCEVSLGHSLTTGACAHTVCPQHQHQSCQMHSHHDSSSHVHKKVYYLVKNKVPEGSHVRTNINTIQSVTKCPDDKTSNTQSTNVVSQNTKPVEISAAPPAPIAEVKSKDTEDVTSTPAKACDTLPSNKELIEEINQLREIIKCINTVDAPSSQETVNNASDLTITSSDYQDPSLESTSLSTESSLCSNCQRDMQEDMEPKNTCTANPSDISTSRLCSDCERDLQENMELKNTYVVNASNTSSSKQNSNHADELWSNMVDAVIKSHSEVNVNHTSKTPLSKEKKPPHLTDSSSYNSDQSFKSAVNEDVYHVVHESGSAYEIQSTSNICVKASRPSFHNDTKKQHAVENLPQEVAVAVKIFSGSEAAAQSLKQAIKKSCLATYEQAINEALKDVLKCFPCPDVTLNDNKTKKKSENKKRQEKRSVTSIGVDKTTLSDCSEQYTKEDIVIVGMTESKEDEDIKSNSSTDSIESIDPEKRMGLLSPTPDNNVTEEGDKTVKKDKRKKHNDVASTIIEKEMKSVANERNHDSLISNTQRQKVSTTVSNTPQLKNVSAKNPNIVSDMSQVHKINAWPPLTVSHTPHTQKVNAVTPVTIKGTFDPGPSNETKKKLPVLRSLSAAKRIFGRTEPKNASYVVRKKTDVKPLKPKKNLRALSSNKDGYKAVSGSRDTQDHRRKGIKPHRMPKKGSENRCKSKGVVPKRPPPHRQCPESSGTGETTPSSSTKKKPAGFAVKNAEIAVLFNRRREPENKDSQEEFFDANEGPVKATQVDCTSALDTVSHRKKGPEHARAMQHVKKCTSCTKKFMPTVRQVVDRVEMVTKKCGNFDKTAQDPKDKHTANQTTQGAVKKKPPR